MLEVPSHTPAVDSKPIAHVADACLQVFFIRKRMGASTCLNSRGYSRQNLKKDKLHLCIRIFLTC